jgi:hypothetical protein
MIEVTMYARPLALDPLFANKEITAEPAAWSLRQPRTSVDQQRFGFSN